MGQNKKIALNIIKSAIFRMQSYTQSLAELVKSFCQSISNHLSRESFDIMSF